MPVAPAEPQRDTAQDPSGRGRLILVPNTLDLGESPSDIRDLLPDGVMALAAGLRYWVAENARSTRAFLKRVAEVHPLNVPIQEIVITELPRPPKGGASARAKSDAATWAALLGPALRGDDLGLISEAGLPAVADPGSALVAQAHRLGVPVQPLAGASSLLLALAASGLDGQRFAFVGYLPQDTQARAARIRELETVSRQHQQTQIVIETPYRNAALMAALLTTLSPTTRLSVSMGLTQGRASSRTDTVAAWVSRPPAFDPGAGGRLAAVFLFLAES